MKGYNAMAIQKLSLIGLVFLSVNADTLAQELPRILVLQVDTLSGASARDASALTNELAKAINRVGNYDVITKGSLEIGRFFEDRGKATPPVLDDPSKQNLGTWWRANFVVDGTLGNTSDKRHTISLEMLDVKQGKTVSTAQLVVADFNHRLLLNRLAQLLVWGRLSSVSNQSPYEATLDTKLLSNEMLDPDYNVWLVQPNTKHTLEVKAKKENYTTYKEDLTLGVAESRVVEARVKYRMGVLVVQSRPEADIHLDERMIGRTTFRRPVQAGEYMLTLTASRHDDVTTKVTIAPEETTFVSETLPLNRGSYRRNGIISAIAAGLFVGGGLYASKEADKAYDQYLETMNTGEMRDRRDKAKTLDIVSYASYGVAGVFVIWSALEWIGLLTADEPSEIGMQLNDQQRLNLSVSNKGLTVAFQFH
jgi:hypothetical protein